eukprot:scaffold221_cov189-Alexandrium_tamarense.AAC.4
MATPNTGHGLTPRLKVTPTKSTTTQAPPSSTSSHKSQRRNISIKQTQHKQHNNRESKQIDQPKTSNPTN